MYSNIKGWIPRQFRNIRGKYGVKHECLIPCWWRHSLPFLQPWAVTPWLPRITPKAHSKARAACAITQCDSSWLSSSSLLMAARENPKPLFSSPRWEHPSYTHTATAQEFGAANPPLSLLPLTPDAHFVALSGVSITSSPCWIHHCLFIWTVRGPSCLRLSNVCF